MNEQQLRAIRLAERLSHGMSDTATREQASEMLRTQHAEIERLNAAIKWEQNRAERIGTHGPGCEKWGPAHFECALQAIERKDALLRRLIAALDLDRHDVDDWPPDSCEAVYAIKQELSQ